MPSVSRLLMVGPLDRMAAGGAARRGAGFKRAARRGHAVERTAAALGDTPTCRCSWVAGRASAKPNMPARWLATRELQGPSNPCAV